MSASYTGEQMFVQLIDTMGHDKRAANRYSLTREMYNFDLLPSNIGHRKMRDACLDNRQINNVRAVCASWSKQVLVYNAYDFDKFLFVFYAFLKLDLNWI